MTDPATAALLADPEWLAHRYDPRADAFHLVAVPRVAQSRAVFLTDEYLPATPPLRAVPRAALRVAPPPRAPIHYLFHSAFCCSTLLARALDRPGLAVALKEPVVLNDIVGWRHRGGGDAQVVAVLDDALALLGRPFGAGEAVVVKPSNIVAGLAAAMLHRRPEARAVLMHTGLEGYLGSIARKGLWGRLWVRDLLMILRRDRLIRLGIAEDDYIKLTDLQVAAVGWLAQHALFAAMLGQFGPARLRSLSSETLLADPRAALAATFDLYGWRDRGALVDEIVADGAFARHSKDESAFDAAARAADERTGAAAHADEIAKVLVWAETLATQAGIAMTLPHPLVG